MKRSKLSLRNLLLAACLVFPAAAQNKTALQNRPLQNRTAEPEHANIRKTAKRAANPAASALSFSNWEIYRNVTLGPGETVDLDSGLNFSSSDLAAITIRASSGSVDLTPLDVLAYWSFPDADFFSVAETTNGSNFPFVNVGGALFNVYGQELRLRLVNNGNSTISLSQVTIRCRSI